MRPFVRQKTRWGSWRDLAGPPLFLLPLRIYMSNIRAKKIRCRFHKKSYIKNGIRQIRKSVEEITSSNKVYMFIM